MERKQKEKKREGGKRKKEEEGKGERVCSRSTDGEEKEGAATGLEKLKKKTK